MAYAPSSPQRPLPTTVADAGAEAYSYQPLPDKDHIRILTLHPSSDQDSPLEGDLRIESLDSCQSYDAVSYVWGDPLRTHSIHISPPHSSETLRSFPLTRSIYDALRRLRLPDRARRLWADQVCINQDDLAERSRQVRLMNRIYRGAAEVLVWLGPDESQVASGAVAMIEDLAEVFQDQDRMDVFRREHLEGLAERDAETWAPLSKLTKLPWFKRIWIVQEIGTTAPATLYWGDSASVSWETLSFVSSVLSQEFHHLRARFQIYTPNVTYLHHRFVRVDDEDAISAVRRTDSSLSHAGSRHHRSCFIFELHRARHLLAKDPRDRVYAFLGHFSLRENCEDLAQLVPDYSLPIEQVYTDVAVRALRGASALRVLSACESTEAKTRPVLPRPDLDLPSWVPDWRATPIHIINTPVTPHRAAGDTSPLLEIDEERRQLHMCGRRIDTISRFSWVFFSRTFEMQGENKTKNTSSQKVLPFEALWQNICEMGSEPFSLAPRYMEGGGTSHDNSALFALAQTLTNGCIGVDRSRPYNSVPSLEWLSHAASYISYQQHLFNRSVAPSLLELAANGDAFRWSSEATLVSRYRRFAVTSINGYYVIGPEALRDGDTIVTIRGGRTPFLIRDIGDGSWKLLGECYVHGIMNGEPYNHMEKEEEWFTLK